MLLYRFSCVINIPYSNQEKQDSSGKSKACTPLKRQEKHTQWNNKNLHEQKKQNKTKIHEQPLLH